MNAWVRAEGVGVRFTFDRQQRSVTPALARLLPGCTESWGLRGADVSLGPGDTVALVGRNGAGKTSLLRVIAGIYSPDEGRLEVTGRVGSLLAVSGGLIPLLTGAENAELLSVLAGRSRAQARAAVPAIRARSGLGDAFDRPVLTYSQGMMARLGFAAIEESAPDILLLDEVHEALDWEFHDVLEARVRAVADAGGIAIAAGQDHAKLARLCRRALLLDRGRVVADGPFEEIVARHHGALPERGSAHFGGIRRRG